MTDIATLSGGFEETGSLTFMLYDPSDTLVDTETVAVDGDGMYPRPTGYTPPTTNSVTGTYQWDASYSGDESNNSVSDMDDAGEQVVVSDASPTLTTMASPAG